MRIFVVIICIAILCFYAVMMGRTMERDFRRERQKQGDVEYYDEYNQVWLWKKTEARK